MQNGISQTPYRTPAMRTQMGLLEHCSPTEEPLPRSLSAFRRQGPLCPTSSCGPLGVAQLCPIRSPLDPLVRPFGFNPAPFCPWLLKTSPHMVQCLESVESSGTWPRWGIKQICRCAVWPCVPRSGEGGVTMPTSPQLSHARLRRECERSPMAGPAPRCSIPAPRSGPDGSSQLGVPGGVWPEHRETLGPKPASQFSSLLPSPSRPTPSETQNLST